MLFRPLLLSVCATVTDIHTYIYFTLCFVAAAYPYTDTDPFILESCPQLFFAGNQSKLEVEYYTQGNYALCLGMVANYC